MTAPDPSPDELLQFWNTGLPLDSAWAEFADSFLLSVLRTDPDKDPLLFGLHNRRYKELSKEGVLPKTAADRKKRLEIVTRNARSQLFREIYLGRRWAIGRRMLPNGGNEIVRVPRNHFLAHHQKQGAELKVGSDSYFDTRVVLAPGETEEPSRSGEGRSIRHKSHEGRPPTKDEILSAIEELWTDPQFQALEDRKEQARMVRAHLRGEQARGKDHMQGYKTSTIRRLIGEHATAELRKTE